MDIAYVEKNVDEPGVRAEMNSKTNDNQTIPVLFVGDKYWVNPGMDVLVEQFKS
jgi:glutaredoxin